MVLKSEKIIMAATSPGEIFSMNAETLDHEYEQYLEKYKPAAYSAIRNFTISQKVTMLYRSAKQILENCDDCSSYLASDGVLELVGNDGVNRTYKYTYSIDTKISKMYVTAKEIIHVTTSAKRKYYDNFLAKTKRYQHLDKQTWDDVKDMLPHVVEKFETNDGLLVIVIKKPCSKIYSLRELLDYCGGKMRPEYVAAIIHRIYHLVAYLQVVGITHNAITVDNLFFAPGRRIKKGEPYTIEDQRFIGLYGGWFFATRASEKLSGVPREVYEVMPEDVKKTGYSSYVTDELSIKRVARELLGDVSGEDLGDIPEEMAVWVNSLSCKENAYEEYAEWERVNLRSFGKRTFVDLDVCI